jgi:hypothetical protein
MHRCSEKKKRGLLHTDARLRMETPTVRMFVALTERRTVDAK